MTLARDTIITQGTRLPPSLGVYGRLQAVLANPDAGLEDIVTLIQIDPALTFQVIKLSNSALFGLRQRCDSLDAAVARVGFADIHQLVGLAVSRRTFQTALELYDTACGRLWENAVAAAVLGAALAECAGADVRNAYATGLLRNIGRVVLNNYPGATRYPGPETEPDVLHWEKRVHGSSAAEVAAVLLEHWRFSPESTEALRHHRAPEAAGARGPAAARLHLAAGLIVGWGCAMPGEETGWRDDDALLACAGVARPDIPAAVERARARFSQCAQIEWSRAA
jgi:HD-like signal output (HDOD) protein